MDEQAAKQLYSPNIAVAVARKGDNRDLSMPWVKDLPVHLLATLFQRMPPELKRQVEMTNHRMAEIMKVHGWRKHDTIDIVIPEHFSGCCRVNDSFDVELGDLVDCVQLLLSRIRVRRFAIAVRAVCDWDWGDLFLEPDPAHQFVDVTNALLDVLLKSKGDGVRISQLIVDVNERLLKAKKIGQVIMAFCESLTHISIPYAADSTVSATIGKCDHLEVLEYGRQHFLGLVASEKNALKDTLSSKTALKSLYLDTNPFDILVAGVHYLNHLIVLCPMTLKIVKEPTADQVKLMSNLTFFECDYYLPEEMPTILNVIRFAPKLEHLHMNRVTFCYSEPQPGHAYCLVRSLADECYRNRRSLRFSTQFKLQPRTLATMMKYDKQFVTSPVLLKHYGVTAFDERLHAFDANLKPPPTEHLPQVITSIDGSRAYKRTFRIDVMTGVQLWIGFDE